MSWAHGNVGEKEVGYGVEATCEHPGCNRAIDRGLAFVCGDMHGEDEVSCDGYFCEAHLHLARTVDGRNVQLCTPCLGYCITEGLIEDDE